MELRQIESFIRVVECESFSLAAQSLHVSQPTVSAHIAALERELDTALVVRNAKRFALTAEGRALYEQALVMLASRDKALAIASKGARRLLIGASSAPSRAHLPTLLATYRRAQPDMRVRVEERDSMSVISQVESGEVDLGLTGAENPQSPCTFTPFASDELVVAAPNTPRYRALARSGASARALLDEPFLVRSTTSGTQTQADRLLEAMGRGFDAMHVVAQIDDAETMRACIAEGLGVGVLSRSMVSGSGEEDRIICFSASGGGYWRNLYLVEMPGRYQSQAQKAFAQIVRGAAEACKAGADESRIG